MQSPEVKQTTVNGSGCIQHRLIVNIFYALFKHEVENDADKSRCQNTTLFHAVDDGEGSREVAVQPNLAALVFLQLDNDTEELWE